LTLPRLKRNIRAAMSFVIQMAEFGKSYPFSEIREDPRFPHVRTIHTKIRGVTKQNADGVDRQRIIRQCCESGDALYVIREPNNPVDENAIQVRRIVCTDLPDKPRLGEQLGYLSRELAEDLVVNMDQHGFILIAKIMEVTGGENGDRLGVNIQIEEYKPATPAAPCF
jgi:HIRAN domain